MDFEFPRILPWNIQSSGVFWKGNYGYYWFLLKFVTDDSYLCIKLPNILFGLSSSKICVAKNNNHVFVNTLFIKSVRKGVLVKLVFVCLFVCFVLCTFRITRNMIALILTSPKWGDPFSSYVNTRMLPEWIGLTKNK